MPYLWADTVLISNYLAAGSKIVIGDGTDDVSVASAEVYENEAVTEVSDILSAGWDGFDSLTTVPDRLKRMAAKLAAARIGTLNIGAAYGELPSWVTNFENQVFAQAQRMVLNNETVDLGPDLVRRDVDLAELMLKTKVREGGVVDV